MSGLRQMRKLRLLPLLQPLRLKSDCREGNLFPPQPPRLQSLAADGNLFLQLSPALKTQQTGDLLRLLSVICILTSGCTPKPPGRTELRCQHPLSWHPAAAEGSRSFLLEVLCPCLKCHPCGVNELASSFLLLSAPPMLGGQKTSSQDDRIMALSSMHTGNQACDTPTLGDTGKPRYSSPNHYLWLLCRDGMKGRRGAFPFHVDFFLWSLCCI